MPIGMNMVHVIYYSPTDHVNLVKLDLYGIWEKCLVSFTLWGHLLTFLALLDYVSRAHEIEIRPSSVVRPSSVCGIDYL